MTPSPPPPTVQCRNVICAENVLSIPINKEITPPKKCNANILCCAFEYNTQL